MNDPDLYEGDMILTADQRMAVELGMDVDNALEEVHLKTSSGLVV